MHGGKPEEERLAYIEARYTDLGLRANPVRPQQASSPAMTSTSSQGADLILLWVSPQTQPLILVALLTLS